MPVCFHPPAPWRATPRMTPSPRWEAEGKKVAEALVSVIPSLSVLGLLQKSADKSKEQLHARLALLPADAAQVNPLYDWMVGTEVPRKRRSSVNPWSRTVSH